MVHKVEDSPSPVWRVPCYTVTLLLYRYIFIFFCYFTVHLCIFEPRYCTMIGHLHVILVILVILLWDVDVVISRMQSTGKQGLNAAEQAKVRSDSEQQQQQHKEGAENGGSKLTVSLSDASIASTGYGHILKCSFQKHDTVHALWSSCFINIIGVFSIYTTINSSTRYSSFPKA